MDAEGYLRFAQESSKGVKALVRSLNSKKKRIVKNKKVVVGSIVKNGNPSSPIQ